GAFLFLSFFSCRTGSESQVSQVEETVDLDSMVMAIDTMASGLVLPSDSLLLIIENTETTANDRRLTYAGKPQITHYPNPLTLLYNECFSLGYDEVRGIPAWVAYCVFDVEDYSTPPRPSGFLIDDRTSNRISHDDYTHSGYDRGHMAPNFAIASRFGADCQRETFLMTNIIPQKPSLNRQWWERLERLIARDYTERYHRVWIVTGPVFLTTGEWLNGRVKVPSHNFMILQMETDGELYVKAFLVHQDVDGNEPHETYFTSIRNIEDLTGLNFNPLWEQSFADSLEIIQCLEMWE
nr:DNA/RNA non-specific endonuclease [Saprospiraceae bacterium]